MQTAFADVLDTVEEFSLDEKEELVDILQKRLRDDRRARLIESIEESRREYQEGKLKTMTVDEIMEEIRREG